MSEEADYSAEREQPCQCQAYLRATERAALVSARWLGRADEDAAEEAAATGMRATLDVLRIQGRVVLGSMDDSGGLTPGAVVGAGGAEVDLALDPLEGRDRKSTRLNSSHLGISYAVFCLKKKK